MTERYSLFCGRGIYTIQREFSVQRVNPRQEVSTVRARRVRKSAVRNVNSAKRICLRRKEKKKKGKRKAQQRSNLGNFREQSAIDESAKKMKFRQKKKEKQRERDPALGKIFCRINQNFVVTTR